MNCLKIRVKRTSRKNVKTAFMLIQKTDKHSSRASIPNDSKQFYLHNSLIKIQSEKLNCRFWENAWTRQVPRGHNFGQ